MNLLARIAPQAAEVGLPFLVAGGHAVITHGYARNTFDLDLIVRREDRDKWQKLLPGLGFALYAEGGNFLQWNPVIEGLLPLDLILVNTETFGKLTASAVPALPELQTVKSVSLLDLLALKCHAIKHGPPTRNFKDIEDVLQLVQINQLDVRRADVRELFLKYGPAELYAKIERLNS